MENLPIHFGSASFKCKARRIKQSIKPGNIEKAFNKKFAFQSNAFWCFPFPTFLFRQEKWVISEFQELKEKLNGVKSKLNDYDLIEWHKHTTSTNIAGDIMWKLKNEFKVEFMTQAWCKFYEIAMSFSLVPSEPVQSRCFNSLHLCEAPGAFITSLNHYLQCFYPDIKWNWKATTLNPYYEGNLLSSMINDDRFIFSTLPNWSFGADYSGDIMNLQNVEHLMQEVKSLGEISLITADGSVDCHNSPAEQEATVSQLHLYETVAALRILAEGGSFVIKIFTSFEAETVCLLYFLNCSFDEVHVFKPVSSKEGNSEVYVVCLKFRGRKCTIPWLMKVWNALELKQHDKVMFPLERIPQGFINQLKRCSEFFMEFQVEAVEKNIDLYGDHSLRFNTKQVRYLTAQHFIKHYKISSLCDETKMVVGNAKLNTSKAFNLDNHLEGGSFSDHMLKKYLHWKEKIQCIYSHLQEIKVLWTYDEKTKWFRFSSSAVKHKVITGRPVKTVYSSKFCSKSLLKFWQNFREVLIDLPDLYSYGRKITTNLPTEVFSENNLGSDSKYRCIDAGLYYENIIFCSENDELEKKCFVNIVESVSCMLTGDNLVLENYPLFTQFNVGVVYLLSSLFLKVGFLKPEGAATGIIFFGFQGGNNDTLNFLKEMKESCVNSTDSDQQSSILSMVPIDVLCGFDHDLTSAEGFEMEGNKCMRKEEMISIETPAFHCCITEINNILLKEIILQVAEKLLRS